MQILHVLTAAALAAPTLANDAPGTRLAVDPPSTRVEEVHRRATERRDARIVEDYRARDGQPVGRTTTYQFAMRTTTEISHLRTQHAWIGHAMYQRAALSVARSRLQRMSARLHHARLENGRLRRYIRELEAELERLQAANGPGVGSVIGIVASITLGVIGLPLPVISAVSAGLQTAGDGGGLEDVARSATLGAATAVVLKTIGDSLDMNARPAEVEPGGVAAPRGPLLVAHAGQVPRLYHACMRDPGCKAAGAYIVEEAVPYAMSGAGKIVKGAKDGVNAMDTALDGALENLAPAIDAANQPGAIEEWLGAPPWEFEGR